MPKYYVYDTQTGDIVHLHETVDGTSGTSLTVSREDVLALVDHPQKENLDVLGVEFETREAERPLGVDVATRQLVTRESRSSG
jgi:hypothetical protein